MAELSASGGGACGGGPSGVWPTVAPSPLALPRAPAEGGSVTGSGQLQGPGQETHRAGPAQNAVVAWWAVLASALSRRMLTPPGPAPAVVQLSFVWLCEEVLTDGETEARRA